MKFAEFLLDNSEEEWRSFYINYNSLKEVLKALSQKASHAPSLNTLDGKSTGVVSLSVPTPDPGAHDEGEDLSSDAAAMLTEEDFFTLLESEISKVQDFTHRQVTVVREELSKAMKKVSASLNDAELKNEILKQADTAGQHFLRVEKFANLNYKAVYKILKKHDKMLPRSPPCRQFYMSRLHSRRQSWMRGDYSDVLVNLSRLFGELRGDQEGVKDTGEKQNFVRSTKKYWVRVEDVSEVKYAILQHLPVFLQENMKGESDSQLVNSVYLDNAQLELYHGRLDKTPGAIALRIRWYGQGEPKLCFVERKTHFDAWTGNVSVKERFTVKEPEVIPMLHGEYDVEATAKKLKASGKSDEAVSDWKTLASQCTQAISSKQLVPTMRTQYMRTAYQIPFDATVRVSLDTNLCMINDRDCGPTRWYRDPTKPFQETDITRFPHAILEVKLQLADEGASPEWITKLINGGMLHEVHKFSKFIHGCATLLPEDVQAVPYWMDDSSLRESLLHSGAGRAGVLDPIKEGADYNAKGANSLFSHLMPFTKPVGGGSRAKQMEKIERERVRNRSIQVAAAPPPPPPAAVGIDIDYGDDECSCCGLLDCCGAMGVGPTMGVATQRVEPKVFFANERTFIHWLHMAVTMSSVGTALLAFGQTDTMSEWYALALMPVSLLFVVYALVLFYWRNDRIHDRVADRWDDPRAPLLLAVCLIAALLFTFVVQFGQFLQELELASAR